MELSPAIERAMQRKSYEELWEKLEKAELKILKLEEENKKLKEKLNEIPTTRPGH